METIIGYIRKRLTEKTTHTALVAALMALIAKYTGASEGLLEPIEEIVGGVILLLVALLPSPSLNKSKANSPLSVGMAVLALLFLSACGPNVSVLGGYLAEIDDPQNKAGLVVVSYKFCENSAGGYEICDAGMIDGKEQAKVDLAWSIDQDGKLTIDYNATDSRAFQAFATRAEVQKALGEELGGKVFDALQAFANPASAITPSINPD